MLPFQLESSSLKGRVVRLGSALDLILHQHAYPQPVAAMLGEAAVLAAALGTSLKYDGVFTFQARGDGAVRLLVADVTSDGGLRAYAKFDADAVAGSVQGAKLFGHGHLAFTVDQKNTDDRYQGIVELGSGSLSEAVQHYFRQSEQLPTGIMAAVRRDAAGRWQGGCLMIQQVPREGGLTTARDTSVEDDWHRAMLLMGTCTMDELVDPNLPPEDLLFRLFHEEGVRVYDPHIFRHQCRCSLSRVRNMLRSLPRAEVEELAINDIVDVVCEFCNVSYKFDHAQRDELYSN
jgi:molecular chaperone Hsp33